MSETVAANAGGEAPCVDNDEISLDQFRIEEIDEDILERLRDDTELTEILEQQLKWRFKSLKIVLCNFLGKRFYSLLVEPIGNGGTACDANALLQLTQESQGAMAQEARHNWLSMLQGRIIDLMEEPLPADGYRAPPLVICKAREGNTDGVAKYTAFAFLTLRPGFVICHLLD